MYYAVYNWTYAKINSSLLYEKVERPAFAVFGGSRNELGSNSNIYYQGYIGATMKELTKKTGG